MVLLAATAPLAQAQDFYQGLPAPLERVGFDQRLGESIDLALEFENETGQPVRLSEVTAGKPSILALVYYNCPMLCSMAINGLVSSLKAVDLVPGEDFEIVVVSFDPDDTAELAAAGKARAVDLYGREETAAGWNFLTGDAAAIDTLTESVGFRYNRLADTADFAHSAGIVLLTPEGQISRYLYGVEYPPRDIRLGLIESAEEKIGTVVDQLLLFCYRYDPATGSYSALTLGLVRVAGVVTVLLIVGFLLLMAKREKRRPKLKEAGHVA
jgi:protein SCO1/2